MKGDGAIFFVVYGGIFVLAVRIFGLRRVLLGLMVLVGLAVYTALRTVSSVAGRR